LIALEGIARGCKCVARVENAVPHKPETIAVHLIAAGFGHGVNGGCSMMSVAGGHCARLDLELLHGVREWQRQIQIVMQIVVIGAVQQIGRATARPARNRDGLRRVVAVPVETGRDHGGPGQENQVRGVAAVQWKFHDALIVDDLTHTGTARFNHRDVRLNLEGLRHLSHLEDNVDYRIAVHLQHDSGLNIGRETDKSRLEPVRTDGQIRKRVRSCFVGDRGAAHTGVCLRYLDLDTRKHSTGWILHRS
jgi:hypothetical protein